jgi:hypothetical protein
MLLRVIDLLFVRSPFTESGQRDMTSPQSIMMISFRIHNRMQAITVEMSLAIRKIVCGGWGVGEMILLKFHLRLLLLSSLIYYNMAAGRYVCTSSRTNQIS